MIGRRGRLRLPLPVSAEEASRGTDSGSVQGPRLLVDVGGVGYELEAPMTTFYSLAPVGEPVVLHTHLAVHDDVPCLYGLRPGRSSYVRVAPGLGGLDRSGRHGG